MATTFRRELPEYVTVTVDGVVGDVDPDVTRRAPGRVVVTMPDFTADALAHVLSHLGRVADLLDGDRVGLSPRDLADALSAAASSTGVRCPERLRRGESVRP